MPQIKIRQTSQFKRDLKKMRKQGRDMNLMDQAIALLQANITLPERYKDHALVGNWDGFRECHLASDWLLVYIIDNNVLILTLTRTGTHSEVLDI